MTDDELSLKPIDAEYIPKAVEKAEHYRLLNWPEESESICLDVLSTDPSHQKALTVIVLALSDMLSAPHGAASRLQQAKEFVARIKDDYTRTYLTGLLHERDGRSRLSRGFQASSAYECFRDAMEWYEKAEAVAPSGNQEAALRFNSCVRTIEREKLEPPDSEPPQSMLE